MPLSNPMPQVSTVSNRIGFQVRSPTGSGANVDVTVSIDFPAPEADITLTEAQKNAFVQKLVDFFNGIPSVVQPVSGTKTYVTQQNFTPTP